MIGTTEGKQMGTKAALWLRVSTGAQDEASQLPDLMRWVVEHGYEHVETYTVHGKSAFHGKQQADLDRAFSDMAAGQFDVLVVWAADRIERRGALAALTLSERARQAGGRIEYVKDAHLNAANDMSDVMLALTATLARQESARKAERIKAKHHALREAGSIVGRAPWGYEIATAGGIKVYAPTDLGREYVPQMFAKAVDGQSLRSICQWLDSEGVPTEHGKRWNEGFLGRLLKNPVYYGKSRVGGKVEVEALVAFDVWSQAGEILATRAHGGRGTVVNEKPLVAPVCAACFGQQRDGCPSGVSPMYALWIGKGAARVRVFRCTGHGPQRKGCGAPLVPVAAVESDVWNQFSNATAPYARREFVPGRDVETERREIEARMAEASERRDYGLIGKLAAEAEALSAAEDVRPSWVEVETGESIGQHFETLDREGQRAYIAAGGTETGGPATRLVLAAKGQPVTFVDEGGTLEDAYRVMPVGHLAERMADAHYSVVGHVEI